MKKIFDPFDPYGSDGMEQKEGLTDEQKRLQLQIDEDLKSIMRTEQGRRFMWRMFERTGVYRCTFRPNSESAFLEGGRAVGTGYLGDCHRVALEESILMMRENANGT